jgi:hypothetical protein
MFRVGRTTSSRCCHSILVVLAAEDAREVPEFGLELHKYEELYA